MLTNSDILKMLALWEFIHETADDGLKAAIMRGKSSDDDTISADRGAFVDGLAALVDARKDTLRAELMSGSNSATSEQDDATARALSELRFEIAALRGRLETMSATLDAVFEKLARL